MEGRPDTIDMSISKTFPRQTSRCDPAFETKTRWRHPLGVQTSALFPQPIWSKCTAVNSSPTGPYRRNPLRTVMYSSPHARFASSSAERMAGDSRLYWPEDKGTSRPWAWPAARAIASEFVRQISNAMTNRDMRSSLQPAPTAPSRFSIRFEGDADTPFLGPDDPTFVANLVGRDHQREFPRDTERAGNVQHGARLRQVAHHTRYRRPPNEIIPAFKMRVRRSLRLSSMRASHRDMPSPPSFRPPRPA